ncbi:MaoC/PaaZ C-terminal domain-containing protein [Pseudarthrobacter raffinosi]|uniref:MaoC/PaaZ C-terminal domain-containing protein n=1 Tax=Pseudarthrobacter raffinosi TaxID=2953651 RepID=UPI00208F1089|nr:MaoC/PaaZ C-terminal domain-containing protein [Pseudarthrobacter sp. MDT3-9]MCO4251239.1 hypothetical protein [Pseudarthrobacter sp. MDT3-9]
MAGTEEVIEDVKRAPGELITAELIRVGMVADLGTHIMLQDDIVKFGQEWDPLAIHVDANLAAQSSFGEIIASGIHTLAVLQRLSVLGLFQYWAVHAGRRLADVKFLRPVKSGEELRGFARVLEVSLNHPDRGLVTLEGWFEVKDVKVLEVISETYVYRGLRRSKATFQSS